MGPGYGIFGDILPDEGAYAPLVGTCNGQPPGSKLRLAASEEGTIDISSGTYRLFLLAADALSSQAETNPIEHRQVASANDALDLTITVDEHRVPFVALVAPGVILNHGFEQELIAAIVDPGLEGIHWLALASDGLDLIGDRFDTGNYLEDPATPTAVPLRLAQWSEPAVSVIRSSALKSLAANNATLDGFSDIVIAGSQDHLPVYLTPRLRYSSMSGRSISGSTPGDNRPTEPSNGISLDHIREDPTVTVVVRTTFERPQLLHRNLVALAAEHQESAILEAIVVSTSDIGRYADLAAHTDNSINTLPLTTLQADEDSVPSRSAAMFAALRAARGDYVWYVDDDDWIAAGSIHSIKEAVHAVDRPILIGASEVFEEEWDDTGLTESTPFRRYLPEEWHRAFTGWNFLPNCSIVLPRLLALQRIAACPITRDLGEDYALQLLLLTAPGSMVQVIDETIAHISRRVGEDNTVTMDDRVPWLRDLGSHISDLANDPSTSTAAFWRLGSEIRNIPYPEADAEIEDASPQLDPSLSSPSPTTPDLRRHFRTAKAWIRRLSGQDST
jgi:hypothetical protein